MTRLALLALACSALLLACPKKVETNVSGSDDENMDSYAAQLEEFRTRENLTKEDACSLKGKVCSISKNACDIAGRHADREDFAKRCAASQEDCAKYNDTCGG